MILPQEIVRRLNNNDYEALYVGGYVRDTLMGVVPKDIDIATNASPADIYLLCLDADNIDEVGKTFGVTIIDGTEVAMYRTETYETMSKPIVEPARDFYQDSSRRDFTINAMGMTADGEIIDHWGGQEDIQNEIIRAVGNPTDRFHEDPSRMLRAAYFAARFNFTIEEDTLVSIRVYNELLRNVPQELIGKIIMKVIESRCLTRFLAWLEELHILEYVFPEIAHTSGMPQNPKYHNHDVFGHILAVVKATEDRFPTNPVLSLAAVLHDNRKGIEGIRGINKEGQPNDLGHEEAGEELAYDACIRLGFGKQLAKEVSIITRFHGIRLGHKPKVRSVMKVARNLKPYAKNKEELMNYFRLIYEFMIFDAQGFTPAFRDEIIVDIPVSFTRAVAILNNRMIYPHELPVDGKYLMEKGFKGKEIGTIMQKLIDCNFRTKQEVDNYFKRKEE